MNKFELRDIIFR